MRLFIFSTQPEISQILHDHFSSLGYLCITFNSMEEFFTSLDKKAIPPELMILDYMLFNHELFNIYTYLEEKDCIYPTIFYNDPCLTRSNHREHWKSQIEIIQNKNGKMDIKKLEPLLADLEKLIENKRIAPSIHLMQTPVPLPQEFISPKITLEYIQQNEDCGIEEFRIRNKLPNNLFYLLKVMQEHQDLRLTIGEIKQIYEDNNKEISENSLYVMMSRLRSIVRTDKQARFIIRKEGEYYHFIRFISKGI